MRPVSERRAVKMKLREVSISLAVCVCVCVCVSLCVSVCVSLCVGGVLVLTGDDVTASSTRTLAPITENGICEDPCVKQVVRDCKSMVT